MIIQWYGQACFRIQSGQTVIFIDPFDKKIGIQPPRGEAHVVLMTHGHSDHNNAQALSGDFFSVDGPGEYEVKGIKILGVASFHDEKKGAERGGNTMYRIDMEDITLAHLGDIGQKNLTDEQREALGEVDVLMIPVGGVYTVNGEIAASIVHQVEPKLVIPMHYKIKGLVPKLEDASVFLKELGYEGTPVDKLTVKRKDLSEERMQVVVMKP
jgi:L-ascorbate metabolism protein UlaG (beta-lactamase superfamily)